MKDKLFNKLELYSSKDSLKLIELLFKLIESEPKTFPLKGKVEFTKEHGVYIIIHNNTKVLHVGKTNRAKEGLNQRLTNHIRGQSSFAKNYLLKNNSINLIYHCTFKLIEVKNSRDRTLLEALTAGLLCPEYIGTGENKNK